MEGLKWSTTKFLLAIACNSGRTKLVIHTFILLYILQTLPPLLLPLLSFILSSIPPIFSHFCPTYSFPLCASLKANLPRISATVLSLSLPACP